MDQLFEAPYTIPDVFDNFNASIMNTISSTTFLVHAGYRLLGAVSGGFGPPVRGQDDRIPDIYDENELNQHVKDLTKRGVIHVDLSKAESWQQIQFPTKVMIVRTLFILEQNENFVYSYLSPIIKNESHLIYNEMDTIQRFYEKYFEPWNSRQMIDFSANNASPNIDVNSEKDYINPQGAEKGSYKVIRGGSWADNKNYHRVASRGKENPSGKYSSIGLRIGRNYFEQNSQ